MTPEDVFIELLGRVAALDGASTLISAYELAQWPGEAVAAMKAQKLITRARPASSTVCPGCERECAMPVHILAAKKRKPETFIVCDKRSDINRVPVPVRCLEQWQASGESIAALLSGLLGLHRSGASGTDATRWEVGMLKGKKHSSHLVLHADGKLVRSLAGHSIVLLEVLTLEDNTFKVDKLRLTRLVDQPLAGAGDVESAAQRRERLKKRVNELKAQGVRAFLKIVAEEESLSITRIKQLIQDDNHIPNPKTTYR
jgi:hypothetical protein